MPKAFSGGKKTGGGRSDKNKSKADEAAWAVEAGVLSESDEVAISRPIERAHDKKNRPTLPLFSEDEVAAARLGLNKAKASEEDDDNDRELDEDEQSEARRERARAKSRNIGQASPFTQAGFGKNPEQSGSSKSGSSISEDDDTFDFDLEDDDDPLFDIATRSLSELDRAHTRQKEYRQYTYTKTDLCVIIDHPDDTAKPAAERRSLVSFLASDFPEGKIPFKWEGEGPEPSVEISGLIQLVYRTIENKMNDEFIDEIHSGAIALPPGIGFKKVSEGRYAFYDKTSNEILNQDQDIFYQSLGVLVEYYNDKAKLFPPTGKLKQYYLQSMGYETIADFEKHAQTDEQRLIVEAFKRTDVNYYGFAKPSRKLVSTHFDTIMIGSGEDDDFSYDQSDDTITQKADTETNNPPKAPPPPPPRPNAWERKATRENADKEVKDKKPFKKGAAREPKLDLHGDLGREPLVQHQTVKLPKDHLNTNDRRPIRYDMLEGTKQWWQVDGRLPVDESTRHRLLSESNLEPELEIWLRIPTEIQSKVLEVKFEIQEAIRTGDIHNQEQLDKRLCEDEKKINALNINDIRIRTEYHNQAELMRREQGQDACEDPGIMISASDVKEMLNNVVAKMTKKVLEDKLKHTPSSANDKDTEHKPADTEKEKIGNIGVLSPAEARARIQNEVARQAAKSEMVNESIDPAKAQATADKLKKAKERAKEEDKINAAEAKSAYEQRSPEEKEAARRDANIKRKQAAQAKAERDKLRQEEADAQAKKKFMDERGQQGPREMSDTMKANRERVAGLFNASETASKPAAQPQKGPRNAAFEEARANIQASKEGGVRTSSDKETTKVPSGEKNQSFRAALASLQQSGIGGAGRNQGTTRPKEETKLNDDPPSPKKK